MRYEHSSPPGYALGHQDRFGGRGRAVPHGSVSNFLTGELAHQSLEFKNSLQRTLRYLRLIRRIGRKKFAALNDRVGNHGTQMIVNASPSKTCVAARILSGALCKVLDDFCFGEWAGQL
jgi:hypothetical protein